MKQLWDKTLLAHLSPGGGPDGRGDLGGFLHHPRLRSARGVRPHPQDDPGAPFDRVCLHDNLESARYFTISVQNIKRNEVRERKREQKEMQRQMEVIV